MAILPKIMHRFAKILTKILACFFFERDMLILWKSKGHRRANIFEKEQGWKTYTNWFQDVLKSYSNQDCDIGIKTNVEFIKPETDPHLNDQFIFYKGTKIIQWEKSVFNKWY